MIARTTLDLRQLHRAEPTSYDFDLSGFSDAGITFIRDHLPNAEANAKRDADIRKNEEAIERANWMMRPLGKT